MEVASSIGSVEAVRVHNPEGAGAYVLICDHASNYLPPEFGTLGLEPAQLERHIAWDPGALPVALALSDALDAPLVQSCISRLVIDCNRPLDAESLFWTLSEDTVIPGNTSIDAAERDRRIALAYQPFHAAIEALIGRRLKAGKTTYVVSVHSFTPIYNGVSRPWHIGIIHDGDDRLAAPLIDAFERIPGINVGVNEPYSPADKVYFTIEEHARSRGLPCAMIEIRNNEIGDQSGQRKWAELLARLLSDIEESALKLGMETANAPKGRMRA